MAKTFRANGYEFATLSQTFAKMSGGGTTPVPNPNPNPDPGLVQDLCVSKSHTITPYKYKVTANLRIKALGAGDAVALDLPAVKKNDAAATLGGRAVQLMYGADLAPSGKIYVYREVSSKNIFLKHDGKGDLVPMSCP